MNTPSTLKIVTLALTGVASILTFDKPAQAFTFTEGEGGTGDAGSLISTAAKANTRPDRAILDSITGTLGTRSDLYQVYLDGTTFLATTATVTEAPDNSDYPDTQLFLFNSAGVGLYSNDDTSANDPGRYNPGSNRSTIRLSTPPPAGIYYLAVSAYDWDPVGSGGENDYLFPNRPRRTVFEPSNSSGKPLAGWRERTNTDSKPFGTYTVILKGVRFTSESATPTPTPSPAPVPPPTPAPVPTPSPIPIPTPAPVPSPSPTVSPDPPPSPTPTPLPTPTPSTPPKAVPEPSSIAGLLTLGALGIGARLRRKRG